MASTKGGKRWNGSVDTLPVPFLNGVLAKMSDYGDRVQFSLTSGGSEPAYQVVNSFDKAMAFDRNHHVMQAGADDYVGANATIILTLEQIRAAIAGVAIGGGKRPRAGAPVKRAAGAPRTTAAMLDEQFSAQRYAYYKENREMLPAGISKYSTEIADLMKKGKTVEAAFDEIGAKYF